MRMTNWTKDKFNLQSILYCDFIKSSEFLSGIVYNSKTNEKIYLQELSKEFRCKKSQINLDLVTF